MKLINKDLIKRVLNSCDVSIYQSIPFAVAEPKNKQDIEELIQIAQDLKLSITARGNGTSTAGQAIGSGIVIDYSKHMNRFLGLSKDYVDVEPGINAFELNKMISKNGLFFPVDPSSMELCTIGGMVANNSSGIHSFMYGDTKHYVEGLEGYWADGSFFSTISGENISVIKNKLLSISSEINKVLPLIPKTIKDSSGYNLSESFVDNETIILEKLLTGSEGTLCLFSKIRLRVIPIPEQRITALVTFDDIEKALRAVALVKDLKGLSAIELLDSELIELTREHFSNLSSVFCKRTTAGLLFEFDGEKPFVLAQYEKLETLLKDSAILIEYAEEAKKRKDLWKFRKSAGPILNRVAGSTRPLRFIEDIAVPFDKILEFYREQKKILASYNLRTAFFGHIGSGHFHINPSIDTSNTNAEQKIKEISQKTYKLVKSLDGTFSAEHGDGILREPYIKDLNPELYNIFVKIKDIIDPSWLLNPGKIISNNNDKKTLRYGFKPVKDIPKDLIDTSQKCHGCNECIKFCESYIKHKDEAYKARGRANLIRDILSGTISEEKDLKKAYKYINACVACGNCEKECPSGVNIPKLCKQLRKQRLLKTSLFSLFLKWLHTLYSALFH